MILRDPARWAMRQDIVEAPTARLINAAMARYANADGRCRPSIEALARTTGLSRRTVQKGLVLLERAGLVTVERGGGWIRRGIGRASSYMIAMAIESPDGHLPCSPFLEWAWKVQVASWPERWILVALAQFSNASGFCDPGASGIGRATGLGERSIRTSLARLDAAGLIHREKISGLAARIRLCEAAFLAVNDVSGEPTDPGASCTVASPTPASGAQNPGTCCTLTTLNNPDTDADARGSAQTCDQITIDALAICGIPSHEAHRLHGLCEPIRWRDELCLDREAVLRVLHRVLANARRADPQFLPTSLAYFTEEMRREAGRRRQPSLSPITGRRWAKQGAKKKGIAAAEARAPSSHEGFTAIESFAGPMRCQQATGRLVAAATALGNGYPARAAGSPPAGAATRAADAVGTPSVTGQRSGRCSAEAAASIMTAAGFGRMPASGPHSAAAGMQEGGR